MPLRLHIGNLPDDTATSQLRDVFGSYGEINDVDIIKNFAFVHFAKDEDANNAMRDLNNSKFHGKEIKVSISKRDQNTGGNRQPRRDGPRRDGPRNRDRSGPRDGPRNRDMGGPRDLGNGPGIFGGGILPTPDPIMGALAALNAQAQAVQAAQAGLLNTPNMGQDDRRDADRRDNDRRDNDRRDIDRRDNDRHGMDHNDMERRDGPDPNVRVRREAVPVTKAPNAAKLGITKGYVIYERYYVDESHPLLRGLSVQGLPDINNPHSAPAPAPSNDDRRDYDDRRDRSRSPIGRDPYAPRDDYYRR